MNARIKTVIILLGLTLAIAGLILIYQDFSINQVRILPISLFAVGVITSYKVLVKTKHKSTKFRIKKDYDNENAPSENN